MPEMMQRNSFYTKLKGLKDKFHSLYIQVTFVFFCPESWQKLRLLHGGNI